MQVLQNVGLGQHTGQFLQRRFCYTPEPAGGGKRIYLLLRMRYFFVVEMLTVDDGVFAVCCTGDDALLRFRQCIEILNKTPRTVVQQCATGTVEKGQKLAEVIKIIFFRQRFTHHLHRTLYT